MEEKRRHRRFSSSKERNFVAKHENRTLGEIRDFSRSGISFVSKDHLEKDNQIGLDLQISGLDQKVPINIQILWSRQKDEAYIYGARLMNINPESKFDIMEILYRDWRKTLNANPISN